MSSRYRDDDYSPPPRGGERWDRERLDSYARRPSRVERDRYEEKRRDSSVRRDRVIYAERDPYEIPYRSRYAYEEESDRNSGAMVHRPRREEEDIDIEIRRREYDRSPPPPPREFERPRFVRRQSSLDTYDRKPMPRYGDVARVREETIMIPAGRRRSPPRYRSPPRFDDYEDVRIDERDRYSREEYDFREREMSRVSGNGPDYEYEEREEIIEEKRNVPKRGKTKMPIRMVNTEVLMKLDYPFEREGDTIIILKALHKDNIDEVIRLSREANSRQEKIKTRYIIEDDGIGDEAIVEKRTEIIKEITPGAEPSPTVPRSVREWDVLSKTVSSTTISPGSSPSRVSKSRSRARSVSGITRHEIIIGGEESASVRAGVGALIIPTRESRKSRDLQAEIRALEDRKRLIELGADEDDHEMVSIKEKRGEIVEVRRDKRAPDPKILKGMLWTLT